MKTEGKLDYIEIRSNKINTEINNAIEQIEVNGSTLKTTKEYVSYLKSTTKPATVLGYTKEIKKFLNFIKKPLSKITRGNIISYLGVFKQNERYAAHNLAFNSIKSLYCYLEEISSRERPRIMRGISSVKIDRKLRNVLDFATEIKPMIDCWSDSIRNKAIVYVLYESMMRSVEFLSLRVKDIDLTKTPSPVYVRYSKTPTGKERPCFLYNSIPVLKEWLNNHPMKSHPDFNNMPLWTNQRGKRGKPMCRDILNQIIQESKKRVGLEKTITPHVFRKSRTYELVKVYKMNQQEVMLAGGWANSSMLDVYYQPSMQDIGDVILNGHGVKTVSEKERQEALKERKIRICGCGFKNEYDAMFCKKCGTILNIKVWEKQKKEKEKEFEGMKNRLERLERVMAGEEEYRAWQRREIVTQKT